jgi:hypothetical protein
MAELVYNWLRKTFVGDATDEGVLKGVDSDMVVSDAGGTTVNIAAGAAYVYGFPYYNTSTVSIALNTPSSQNRIDRIVLRADWTAQTVRIAVVEGTEGSGSAPSLTQSEGVIWEIPLARVTVTPAGDLTSLVNERVYLHPNIEVDSAMLAGGAVTSDMLADGGVIEAKIGTGAVTNTKLGAGAVTNDKLADLTILEAKLASAVAAQLVTGGDSHDHIGGDGAQLGTNALADGAVTNYKLADNSVNWEKISQSVPILRQRISTGQANWSGAGSTMYTYNTAGVAIQIGMAWVNIAASAYSGTYAVTFPSAYFNIPFIMVGAPFSNNQNGEVYQAEPDDESTTGFILTLWRNTTRVTSENVAVPWMAIGQPS